MKSFFSILLILLLTLPWLREETVAQDKEGTLSVSVKLVEVYASVRNSKGKPIPGLNEKSFQVLENGQKQEIRFFESDTSSLTVALLIDSTGSIAHDLPKMKKAGAVFLSAIRPEDTFGLFSFTNRLKTLYPFGKNSKEAVDAFMKIEAGGRTAFYDSLAQMVLQMKPIRGRKAIMILTDADDNASLLPKTAAVTAAKKASIPIYPIAVGRACDSKALSKRLEDLAVATGGLIFEARKPEDLLKVFDKIATDLRSLYMMAYYMPEETNTQYRSISIVLPQDPHLKIRAKKGYWP
ncbi:MAG: VWA domain-containing protein [Terriglobia bacterium]